MADTVAAITGLGPEEAANFLEMAGGDVEAAVSLFFEMGSGGGGAAFGGPTPPPQSLSATPVSPVHALLFGSALAPPSWLEQGLVFSTDILSRCGLTQEKNGPCGVLAAINAEVVAELGCPLPSTEVNDKTMADALAVILWRCGSDS